MERETLQKLQQAIEATREGISIGARETRLKSSPSGGNPFAQECGPPLDRPRLPSANHLQKRAFTFFGERGERLFPAGLFLQAPSPEFPGPPDLAGGSLPSCCG
jgi:hypothetical protein